MLDSLSRQLARSLKKHNVEADLEVLEYGIGIKLNRYGVLILTSILGILLHQWVESLIALISISVLRRFSGGVHFRSLTHCMLVTSLTCTLIPMISLPKGTLMLLASISFVITGLRAPNWFEEFTVIKPRMTYKLVSLMIVSLSFFVQSSILIIAFFIQTLTLLPLKGGHYDEETCR
ncbi:hypothetical protein HII26_01910 [Paenibacillus aquistagni]|nr:hypothetical protein [Paenibacillus aquistagni]